MIHTIVNRTALPWLNNHKCPVKLFPCTIKKLSPENDTNFIIFFRTVRSHGSRLAWTSSKLEKAAAVRDTPVRIWLPWCAKLQPKLCENLWSNSSMIRLRSPRFPCDILKSRLRKSDLPCKRRLALFYSEDGIDTINSFTIVEDF